MKKYLILLITLLITPWVQAVELMKWERIPLQVALNIGKERIIFLDKNVRIGFPVSLKGKLRIQSSGGAVYLLANDTFPATRLQLQNVENGELILLDITANDGQKALEPVRVIYDGELTVLKEAKSIVSSGKEKTNATQRSPGVPIPVALTRYAAQSLYAPQRAIEPLSGVRPIALRLPTKITTLLPDEWVEATPLSAWTLNDYSVMAIKLTSKRTQEKTLLDPRQLQGNFISATFQHRWLGHQGTAEDTTVVYLVVQGSPEKAFIPEPYSRR